MDVPWAAIVAVLAASAGFVLYQNALQTSRPSEREGFHSDVSRPQDVDARLWQDPLRAASEHNSDLLWRYKDAQDLDSKAQQQEERDRHDEKNFFAGHAQRASWVLAVMFPGNAYAEYTEARLRVRQAVLEGLGANNYVPNDGEHIGYFKVSQEDWGWHDVIIPYEWCSRDFTIGQGAYELPDNVCVLWLRDDEFRGDKPLLQLHTLLHDKFHIDTSNIQTRIIGPYSSATLREMVEEAEKLQNPPGLLENVDMWCPTATASDRLLLQQIAEPMRFQKVDDFFRSKFVANPQSGNLPFAFKRSTRTDDEIMEALMTELQENRGLHIYSNDQLADKKEKDRIAVVSEWDTFFGRALPWSTRYAMLKRNYRQLPVTPYTPTNILTFNYLRGIDGMLPVSVVSTDSNPKVDATRPVITGESTEGLNQADYLRRLAGELQKSDVRLRRDTGHGIEAIGALGADVFDKLLVLQALRRSFPDAIFFTNVLDARLAHPNEWRWTRNLLVASPFGLNLNEDLQKVPPFRDSNQTAFYDTARRIARGERARDFTDLGEVRLYEIGRGGIFDLTEDVKLDLRWFSGPRKEFAIGIFVVITAGLVWIFRVILGRRSTVTVTYWYRRVKPHLEARVTKRPVNRLFGLLTFPHGNLFERLRGNWALLRWHFWRETRSSRRIFGSSWAMLIVLTVFSGTYGLGY